MATQCGHWRFRDTKIRIRSYIHHMKSILLFLSFLFMISWVQSQGTGEADLAQEYFTDGEYAKALESYERLYKQDASESLYAERILECYIRLNQTKEALDFADKAIRKNTEEPAWIARKGEVHYRIGKPQDAKKVWDDLINKKLREVYGFSSVANWFASAGHGEEAIRTLLQGRKVLADSARFTYELAGLYAAQKNYTLAASEYLNLFNSRPDLSGYVRVQLIKLVTPESQAQIEKALLEVVQKNSTDQGLREILIDFYLETQNFQEALVQTRALDRVTKGNGERVYRLALTFQSNKRYEISNKALDYIIENHSQSPYYLQAWNEKAINTEIRAMEMRPLDSAEIRKSVVVFEDLEKQFGKNPFFYSAFIRKANLLIYYLNDQAYGKRTLEEMFQMPLNPHQKGEVNLMLGDVLLIEGEYNAARLKYGEVEDAFKQDQMGAKAKYKGALLSYYRGDFDLSAARLKSLKENTANDISNDALKLNLLIQDNTGLDSTVEALQTFARAQLLIYQNRTQEAMTVLDSILFLFPKHSLTDEIYWEKASIYLKRLDIPEATKLLEKILKDHPYDILADDALFTLAEIQELHLKNKEKAAELYLKVLSDYPGSLFKVEARKRIRSLRGENL